MAAAAVVSIWHQEQENSVLLKSAPILVSKASKVLISAHSPMCSNCSPFLPAPPWHFLAALGTEGFLLFSRGPRAASERISGPQDAEEAKASLFLGASRPSPTSRRPRRPRGTEGPFPRSGTFKESKKERRNSSEISRSEHSAEKRSEPQDK